MSSNSILWTVILAGALGACGGDDEGGNTPPPVPAGGVAAGAAGAGSGSGGKLISAAHVEDRVSCPLPQKVGDRMPTPEDKCDPTVPTGACKTKAKPYCLNVPIMNGDYCFACTDKDNIRHAFRDRDFAPDQNRDPFQSFILTPVGTGSDDKPAVADKGKKDQCTEHNSYAGSYSFQDLKFIGLVTQGTQRKALMTAGVRSSYILSRNDCVGKEKAIVQEIGDGYITFVNQGDPNVAGSKATELTQNLHTSLALNVDAPPSEDAAVPTSTSGGANTPLPSRSTPLPQTPTPTPSQREVLPKRVIPIPAPSQSPQVVPAAPVRIAP